MVMVLQVHRRTTWLVPFEKVVLLKIQIQVSLPFLKLNKSIPLYKEKGKLIHNMPWPFLIWARLVSKEFPVWSALWNKTECL